MKSGYDVSHAQMNDRADEGQIKRTRTSTYIALSQTRKIRRKKDDSLALDRSEFQSVFAMLPHEILGLILKYGDKYDLTMFGGVCWAFYQFRPRREFFKEAPFPPLDYTRSLAATPYYVFHGDRSDIKVLNNGDSISKFHKTLHYLRFGSNTWEALYGDEGEEIHITNAHVIDDNYLIIHDRQLERLSIWCIRDADDRICRQKLQCMQYDRKKYDFFLELSMHICRNNTILVFTYDRIISVIKYNSGDKATPFSFDESCNKTVIRPQLPLIPRNKIIIYQNIARFECLDAFYSWDVEINQLNKWSFEEVKQRIQAVLPENVQIIKMSQILARKPDLVALPHSHYVMSVRADDGLRSRCFLINLKDKTPPTYIGYDIWKIRKTSQGDFMVVGEDHDGKIYIRSDWDCHQNVFNSICPVIDVKDNPHGFDRKIISAEGNLLLYDLGLGYMSDIVVWDKKSKIMHEIPTPSRSLLAPHIKFLPSGNLAYMPSLHSFRILDGQTGACKQAIKFARIDSASFGYPYLNVLPSGDIQVTSSRKNTGSETTRIRIYRFGIWRKPVDTPEQPAAASATTRIESTALNTQ